VLDPKVRPDHQRQGVGAELVRLAVVGATQAGCEWLHVDFEHDLSGFYLGPCGFQSTPAGLMHLWDW